MHEKSKTNQNLALFDFDGTLYKHDSFTRFIFYALPKKHIIQRGIKILPWIQAYYLSLYPAHKMRPKLFHAMFRHLNSFKIERLAQAYAHHLIQDFHPKIFEQLKCHQQRGDRVVLVSATIDLYLKYVAEYLNVEYVCSQIEIDNHFISGFYSSADCSCQMKVDEILKKYTLSEYKKIYAYGNSDEDLAMLTLADFSYYVGKDKTLPSI